MRFLDLGLADPLPDANTALTFGAALARAAVVDARFNARLREWHIPLLDIEEARPICHHGRFRC
jgi:hypothetical protein